ncbi:MAG: trans-sulfuration enzyme family protein [Candidatus Zixiibacteriota bacterium]
MKESTIAVHGRHPESHRGPGKPAVFPIYQSSTFFLGDEQYKEILSGNTRGVNLYTRLGNPTIRNAAERFADLHGAERGEVYASGLGAISAALMSFLNSGDSLVTSLDIYGGTVALINRELSRFGIEIINVDPSDADAIEAAVKDNTKVLYFETITNPLLKVPNIPAIVEIAKKHGLVSIIDNTFASPANFRPLEHGVDIVLESSTKFLGGHSDIVGGVVCGRDELMKKVWTTSISLGANADPFAAFLLERGMKTLPLRYQRQSENAMKMAKFMTKHKAIEKVIYPGLEDHPNHKMASKLLKYYGGLISFVVKGGNDAGLKMLKNLKFPVEATSLGGVESLIEMPFNTSHAPLTQEELDEVGIIPGFTRLSLGIEDIDDLIDDLRTALDTIV